MGAFLAESDLTAFVPELDGAKAAEMIADAEALAVLAAPCLTGEDFDNASAVKAILRGAVLRWLEAGTGAIASQSAGPYAVTLDTRTDRRSMFWPSEIASLRNLCSGASDQRAFMVDTLPAETAQPMHSDICSIRFGGDCSCGAILAGYYGGPLW